MLTQSISWIMNLFAQCYSWFVQLLEGMQSGGWSFFLAVFLGLFVVNRFIDLIVMRFIYSPSSVDRGMSSDIFKAGANKVKGG